jgi:anti-sigma-K factor RskA
MNLLKPALLQALAREHALGTLQGGARRRFERLLRDSAQARAELARWQEAMATLAAEVPPMQPREQVWQGLTQRLGLLPANPVLAPRPWWRALLSTRVLGGVLAGALVGIVASTALLQANPAWLQHETLREELPPSYVGLLSTAAGQAAVLLSSRRQGRVLTAKMLQPLPAPAGQVALLWAFPKGGAAPFLVGVVPEKGSGKLPLPDTSEKLFFTVDRLGVSFEARGAPPAAPTNPLVVSGPCVKLW